MDSTNLASRLKHAKSLSTEIDADLANRPAPKTVLEQMRKSALADLRSEIGELVELLSTTRPRLVFIGQVGVGKTTAICHLVGLTANRKKKKTNKAGVEKTVGGIGGMEKGTFYFYSDK